MADGQKKIMVVEDDRFLSSLMKARFEKDGYAVVQGFDGEEAIQFLKMGAPDILVLDLILPKTNGFEVMQMMTITPGLDRVPIVILSNLAQDADIEKARQLGAKEYFVKVKVSIDDLITKVESMAGPSVKPAAASTQPPPPPM